MMLKINVQSTSKWTISFRLRPLGYAYLPAGRRGRTGSWFLHFLAGLMDD